MLTHKEAAKQSKSESEDREIKALCDLRQGTFTFSD